MALLTFWADNSLLLMAVLYIVGYLEHPWHVLPRCQQQLKMSVWQLRMFLDIDKCALGVVVRGITLVENDCSSFSLLFHVTYIFLNIAFLTHLFYLFKLLLVFIRQAPGLYVLFISCILFFCLKKTLFVPFLTFTWFFSFSLHWNYF